MIKRLFQYHKKIRYLKAKGWYLNLSGGYTHPHCMMVLKPRDIWSMTFHEITSLGW